MNRNNPYVCECLNCAKLGFDDPQVFLDIEDSEWEELRHRGTLTDRNTQFIINKTCYPKSVGYVILDESEHLYLVQDSKEDD